MTKQASTARAHREDRPHVSDLVLGFLDARMTHVPYLDTVGGAELRRIYHEQHERRRRARTKERAATNT